MPATLVSFLGTGRKNSPQDPRSEYTLTTYGFTHPRLGTVEQTTSLFGAALLRFLLQCGATIDRWLVLGTSASLWSELNQVLDKPGSVLEEYCQIDDKVLTRSATAGDLETWQGVLNAQAAPVEFQLCLTGEGLEQTSQQKIARALFDHVPRGNDIIFDISHGFRHQPVIATYVVSLMRWTHAVRNVSFFSGVWEARQNDVAPVVELPICQELVEAAEAAAVLDVTGNYEPVAQRLGLDASLAWFMESTNQLANARKPAKQLADSYLDGADIVQAELARLLRDRLQWASHGTFAARCRESAGAALEHGDYVRAAILAYEAIISQCLQLLYRGDLFNYEHREAAEQELFNRLSGDDRRNLKILQWTRNACAHGTRSNQAEAQQALRSPQDFRALVIQSFDLFARLPTLLTP